LIAQPRFGALRRRDVGLNGHVLIRLAANGTIVVSTQ
jgi:hypothetical protein